MSLLKQILSLNFECDQVAVVVLNIMTVDFELND